MKKYGYSKGKGCLLLEHGTHTEPSKFLVFHTISKNCFTTL